MDEGIGECPAAARSREVRDCGASQQRSLRMRCATGGAELGAHTATGSDDGAGISLAVKPYLGGDGCMGRMTVSCIRVIALLIVTRDGGRD